MCSSLVLEWRSLVRAVLVFILPALHDWRAGFLGMDPARVFVLRGARMACNECGGYREELVLSPRRDSMLTHDPPYVSFLLFRRGLLSSSHNPATRFAADGRGGGGQG